MRVSLCAGLAFAFAAPAFAQTSSFQTHVVLSGRAIRVKSEPSWTQGGFGRFDVGADAAGDSRTTNIESAQLGFDWMPARWLLIHADGLARREPSATVGRRGGLVQAYADIGTERLRLRAGTFWLPTSRENIDPMWNSRYTITYSALNSWVGQEMRPVGADVQFAPNFYVTAGATAFRGNDTMGTLIADRGWTFGNRLTVYDETVAVPPTDDITKPIGRDLDGRTGFAERLRVQLPERAMLQVTHVDNRADLVPGIAPNIPWQTTFNIVGAEVGSTSPITVAGEWGWGTTTVAFPGGTFALDFGTAYLLASRKAGPDRLSARVERFWTRDEFARDTGNAWTVAWLRDLSAHARAGLEFVRVNDRRAGGSTITFELRLAY